MKKLAKPSPKPQTLDKKTVSKRTPVKVAPKAPAKAPVKRVAKAPAKTTKGTNKVSGNSKSIKETQQPRKPGFQNAATVAASAAQMLRDAQKQAAAKESAAPRIEAAKEVPPQEEQPAYYAQVFADIMRNFDLSEREARFVMEMAVDGNASAAYIRAGYREKGANAHSSRLVAKGSIQAALAHVRAKVADRTGFSAEEALQLAADILRADTRELVQYKVSNCRYCYGDQHRYQRTLGEMAMDRVKHAAMVARRQERNKDYEDPGFDEQGGEGFDLRRMPNTECPVCAGEGAGRVVIMDTRHVSKAAAALYAGVKEGKDGIEVKFHDKATMLDKMFRYHGLYEVDNRQKATAAADPAALIALSEAMERSRMERRALMEHRKQLGFAGD